MYRSVRVAAFLAALALALPTAAVAAPRPPTLGVTFAVHTVFSDTTWSFTAGGPAVDVGFVCSGGTVEDVSEVFTGRGPGVNLQIEKEFVCGDGSGSFVLKLQVRLDKRGDHFSWNVVSGTDDYGSLRGAGSGFGIGFEGGVDDYYAGQVRLS